MGITWQYHADSNLVCADGKGAVTASDMFAHLDAVLADPHIQPGFVVVLSMEDARVNLTFGELMPFSDIWRRCVEKGCRGVVVVAPSDATFGSFRMVQTMLDQPDAVGYHLVRNRVELDRTLIELR